MKTQKITKRIKVPEKLLNKPFGNKGLSAVLEEINDADPFNRAEIARRVCKRLDWKSPGGQYQLMSARVGLLRLHRAGLITLPAPIRGNGNGKKLQTDDICLPRLCSTDQPVDKLKGLTLQRVNGSGQSAIYNALMERYHYLGYVPMAGAQVRYLFRCEEGVLGAIGFGASAWKISPRDRFIGWDTTTRESRLHLIVNNSRFLILPEVRCANLASRILSLCAKRVPEDFQALYGYRPVLFETFVERNRFRGVCYQAANWHYVGKTQGRGKKHVYRTPGVAVKDIWLYPLCRGFRRVLLGEGS